MFKVSAGRPKAIQNELFPMDNAKFQQRLMFISTSQEKIMKEHSKLLNKILSRVSVDKESDKEDAEEFAQARSTNDLKQLEGRLSNKDTKKNLMKHFRLLGQTCDDMNEHIRKVIKFLMNTSTEVLVNVSFGNNVPGKKYKKHVALKNLPNLFSILLAVVKKKWHVDEKRIKRALSEYLKGATKRLTREKFQASDNDGEQNDQESDEESNDEEDESDQEVADDDN
jgi:4-hydroxy-L-threonine phosphate dehydrogenase PdxA